MAAQQKIPLTALLLWSALLLLFVGLNHAQQAEGFPVPADLTNIRIEYAGKVIALTYRDHQWQTAGQNTLPGRVAQVLNKLRACNSPYPTAAISQSPNPHPVLLQLNGRTYTLGAYNRYRHSHYLNDGRQSWLCDESLKAMLAQPAHNWLPGNITQTATEK